MPSLIGNMLGAYAIPMQEFACGTLVRIQCGSTSGPEVTAIVEMADNEELDRQTGLGITIQSRNYVINRADYQVHGEVVEPREGHVIHETVNGVAYQFQVLPIAGKPAFEPDDADQVRWLLRTKA